MKKNEKTNLKTMGLCNRLLVPKNCCYVQFGEGEYHVSNTGLRDDVMTISGDWVIFDFDNKGRLIGLELMGKGKKCQSLIGKKE